MSDLTYPVTRTVDAVDDYHGTRVPDPYRWLEDTGTDEVRQWIEAQNRVTFAYLRGAPGRGALRERLTALWNHERRSIPVRRDGRLFATCNDGLQPQAVLTVQDERPGAAPRVLLDPNTLSEDGTVSLAAWSVSRDGRWLAWAASTSGSDWLAWRVREVATGQDTGEVVRWSKFSGAAWDAAGEGFYYGRYAEPRPGEDLTGSNTDQKLYHHRRGTDQAADVLVYERPDHPEWGFAPRVTHGGRWLVITVWRGTDPRNGIFLRDLDNSRSEFQELLNDFDAGYDCLGILDGTLYLRTDLDAPRGRVVAVDLDRPGREHWRTLIPEGSDPIESVSLVHRSLIVTTLYDVASRVRIHDLDGDLLREVPLPGLGTAYGFGGRPDDTVTYCGFDSYLHPFEIHRFDLAAGTSERLWRPDIDFPLDAFTTERVFATSRDGTRIPVWIVRRRDLVPDGQQPTLLYGYGGFDISLTPGFRVGVLPWLERGGIYAVANIRGGGEYGEGWHQAGTRENKRRVFEDFEAAAEHLIASGWTRPDRLAIQGGSNGGLLTAAVINRRPDLFGAALVAVGVLDLLRFQHFTIGWAWTSEYGSSDDPEMFPVLHALSPYHNLREGERYPAVLVTTADHDDRVVPAHSFKYIARLQACQAGDAPVLIRVQTRAGHGAGKPTAMIIEETADVYAFLLRALGL